MRYVNLAVAFFLISSCSHIHPTTTTDEINFALTDEIATIYLSNGEIREAIDIQVVDDSTRWYDTFADQQRISSNSDILKVQLIDKKRGAFEGFIFGSIFGALAGAMVGLSEGADPETDANGLSSGEKALLRAVIFGSLGGLFGLPVGSYIGSRDVYHLPKKFQKRE